MPDHYATSVVIIIARETFCLLWFAGNTKQLLQTPGLED